MLHHPTVTEIEDAAASRLTITLTDNRETVGVGLVPTAVARQLVPAPFRLPDDTQPVTPLVVLANEARAISVAGRAPEPGVYVKVGLLIDSPDGTGEFNTLLLWHYTNHRHLARGLRHFGLESQYVLALRYVISLDGEAGAASVDVPRPALPPLTMSGPFAAPSLPLPDGFVANMWARHEHGLLKLATTITGGLIGEAQLGLRTDPDGPLGRLIGGSALDLAVIQRFNTFASGRSEISVLRDEEAAA